MQSPPLLTDRAALMRNRSRATAGFMHDHALLDVQERLKEVNRTFTRPVVITGNPQPWSILGPTIPDEDLLSLQPHSHDLIVHALALHWSNDPVGQLVQCRRALVPDGLFLGMLFAG
jgi:hypothetical protein